MKNKELYVEEAQIVSEEKERLAADWLAGRSIEVVP